ncbi:MAG: pyridine nucleotide-disulfide oxidoreductase [Myxococcota bacterium]
MAHPSDRRPTFRYARPRPAWTPIAAGAACVALLAWGWVGRDEYWLAAEEGLGYALGPIGLGAMVLLLAYSIRKRWRVLEKAGSVRTWFHVHMALGLLGPTAILLHANFEPGSLNSRIALACMLAVAGSGLVGRFVYTRIHYEALGRKAALVELRQDAGEGRDGLGALLASSPALAEALEAHERVALGGSGSVFASLRRTLRARPSGVRVRRRARRELRALGDRRASKAARDALHAYLRATRRVADYALCERVFALWHAFHLPLCVLLFAAAIVHVVAVHRY